jgi:hypothetical protein
LAVYPSTPHNYLHQTRQHNFFNGDQDTYLISLSSIVPKQVFNLTFLQPCNHFLKYSQDTCAADITKNRILLAHLLCFASHLSGAMTQGRPAFNFFYLSVPPSTLDRQRSRPHPKPSNAQTLSRTFKPSTFQTLKPSNLQINPSNPSNPQPSNLKFSDL